VNVAERQEMNVIKDKMYLVESEATKNQDVAKNVAQEERRALAEIGKNEKVTREQIAVKAGVSKKTVECEIKKMCNVHYVGRGYSGHWIVD